LALYQRSTGQVSFDSTWATKIRTQLFRMETVLDRLRGRDDFKITSSSLWGRNIKTCPSG
jgi:hypothetical protein